MALVFGDDGEDFGQFPNLMAEGLGVVAGQGLAAASAGRRPTGHDGLTFFDGDQGPFVFDVTGLAAGRASRAALGARRFGVRMTSRRRLGRVGRVFAELGFQFGHAGAKEANLLGLPLNQGEGRWRQRG
jgi:hypothetical protein